jgi:hypothetical protein
MIRQQKMIFHKPGQDPLAPNAELFQAFFDLDPEPEFVPRHTPESLKLWQEYQVEAAEESGKKLGLVMWKISDTIYELHEDRTRTIQ